MIAKFKRLHKNAVIPKQATEFDGGWDVTVTEIEYVEPDFVICKLGFALELPVGYKLTLVPRSNLTKYQWVVNNSPGLGDALYKHEYQIRFRAIPNGVRKTIAIPGANHYEITYPAFPYKVGDRIGQVYVEQVIPIEWKEVEEFETEDRGGGFGSTGV